jgi:glycosyltransferase involved in cell wall biosynthesis
MKVSVVISALNNKRTIAQVIGQAKQVKAGAEIIVVCSGYYEVTAEIAVKAGATQVLTYPERLSLAASRSRGAARADGDIILFVDGDCVIGARQLQAFLNKLESGWDIALNKHFSVSPRHEESMAKRLLNDMLDKPELHYSSLAEAPFALNKRALRAIGADLLDSPVVAHAKAILSGMTVTLCDSVDMKAIRVKTGRKSGDRALMLAEHMKAIALLVSHRGERGGFTDFDRCRNLLTFPPKDADTPEGRGTG